MVPKKTHRTNPIARALRTPKYRPQSTGNKKAYNRKVAKRQLSKESGAFSLGVMLMYRRSLHQYRFNDRLMCRQALLP